MVYIAALHFIGMWLYIIRSLNDQNTLIIQSTHQNNYLEEHKEIHFHHHCQVWSGQDAIINACDPMQNLGQTRIFYKLGQICFTLTKCDPVDLGDSAQF